MTPEWTQEDDKLLAEINAMTSAPAPAWHARPTSPGWWLACEKDGGGRRLIWLADGDKPLEELVLFYGPIPEPPEMPT